MEERGPILRLLLVAAIGLALVLLARWMAERMARASGDPPGAAHEGRR